MTFVTFKNLPALILLEQEIIMNYKLHNDDCVAVLRSYPDNYFDSIAADPPAGISFMGKGWDHDKGGRDAWIAWMQTVANECLRTLKPGGHAAIWALPRTSHWVATAWENAGFEVRDRISHVFGSGFPKSYNVAKGIEGIVRTGSANWSDWKELGGEEYESKTGYVKKQAEQGYRDDYSERVSKDVELTTDEAKQWDGWGTALKPAMEDWWLFRKPISEKNVALNVLKWGTGALNIDASRIELDGEIIPINKLSEWSGFGELEKPDYVQVENKKGRWPANFIHDGSDEVLELFPVREMPSGKASGPTLGKLGTQGRYGNATGDNMGEPAFYGDKGSVARFFYAAKPTKAERDDGLWDVEKTKKGSNFGNNGARPHTKTDYQYEGVVKNTHPTVKSQALMKYIVTLITPPNGVVLDCFMGSGSTGVAAVKLGFGFVGIDNDKEFGYFEIAEKRIKHAARQMRLL